MLPTGGTGFHKYSGRQKNKVEDKKIYRKTASIFTLFQFIQRITTEFRTKQIQAEAVI
jgi:hypothetical protein